MSKSSKHVRQLFCREVTASEGADSRRISGYAVVFDTPSVVMWSEDGKAVREQISSEAIDEALIAGSDIRMTMFHDGQLILARSAYGQGTLHAGVDAHGVSFEFDAPRTVDGDKALELVRRGDIAGCSFAFCCDYSDREAVERIEDEDGVTYIVRHIDTILDFTLTDSPAYPDTDVSARECCRAEVERIRRMSRRSI